MGGSLDGSKETVKMEHFVMWAGIGKPENEEDGMGAQIYFMKIMKTLWIL